MALLGHANQINQIQLLSLNTLSFLEYSGSKYTTFKKFLQGKI